ncbi:MAG TPA: hypothetical protein VNY73_04475, partial [Bacteroidia bacterium]|nr:hypothetical protein [Bacteroidia bacterium]
MKRYLYIFCSCFYLLFLFSEKASAQACSATWNLNSSTTPAITGAITASSPPSFGGGLLNTGTGDPNYGSYGNNWPTSSTVPTPSTSTKYIQFSVTPTCGTLTLTSINFNSYNNEGVPPDYVAVFWSTSSTFATSTSIVTNLSTPSGANNYTNNALASVNCAAGQTIYFRVYFYYAGSTSVYFGIKNMILSGSTGSCCAAPSTQASSLSFSGVSCGGSSITANWTRGNGNDVMVVVTAGGASTGPSSGTAYTANTVYGSGTACGGGYVVYNGTGTSVTVTGLTAGTTYYFDIYEYNTAGTCYLTTSLESSTSIPNNNDNWACATTLTVGAAATSGSTAGATLQANESTGCNSVAAGQLYTVDQSVWYKFVASATTNYVQITQLTGCYNTFGAVAWDPSVVSASNGSTYQTTNINGAYCGMLNCQGGYGNNAASNPFLFELCNLTIGNTYYMQIVNSSSSCGASATFSISVSGSNPGGTITNPCHPAGQGANS